MAAMLKVKSTMTKPRNLTQLSSYPIKKESNKNLAVSAKYMLSPKVDR